MEIDKQLDEAARKYAKIKPNIDVNDEDERYYNSYNLAIYDAFVNGAKFALEKSNKVITELTETIMPEDMKRGSWYIIVSNNTYLRNGTCVCIFKFKEIKNNYILYYLGYNCTLIENCSVNNLCHISDIKFVREATQEEILKYFPHELEVPTHGGNDAAYIQEVTDPQI